MARKNFLTVTAALLMSLTFTACAFAANDIDLGEGYHAPKGFLSILITNSDGTAIQNAVNNIAPGGTILLSGNFNLKQSINIKKNLSIIGKNTALLNAQSAKDRVIRCQGDITLKNLKITGGNSTNGGGVKVDGGIVNIISCDIYGNKAILGGGGIHSSAKELYLTSCDIHDNTSILAGGGISAITGTTKLIECNVIRNEAQFLEGGGIGILGCSLDMEICNIKENKAGNQGGGIALLSNAKATAWFCDISYNTSKGNGGGIYISKSTMEMTHNCEIGSNNAVKPGGGIYAENSTITMGYSIIFSNTVNNSDIKNSYGGGIAASETTITMSNGCQIRDNECIVSALNESEMKGVGLSLMNKSTATTDDSRFLNNYYCDANDNILSYDDKYQKYCDSTSEIK